MKVPCLDCGKIHEQTEECANKENCFMHRSDSVKIEEALDYLNDLGYSSDAINNIKILLTENDFDKLPERLQEWLNQRNQ